MTINRKMGKGQSQTEPQTARHQADKPAGETPSPTASAPGEAAACPAPALGVEAGSATRLDERAKVQQKCRHGEALRRQFSQAFEDGEFARVALAHHIYRSLPARPSSRPSILQKCWFSVHRAVAELALRQAHRAVHQLGLKQIGDTRGFVADHCGWYMSFCALVGWIDRVAVKLSNLKVRG